MVRCSILALLLALTLALPAQAYDLTLHEVAAEVYYSPRGGATEALVHRIDRANTQIYVLAYSFTSEPIAAALGRAARRGVHVEAILDRGQRRARGSQGQPLAESGAMVFLDSSHAIAHNKVMILDNTAVATGSFNFTGAAESGNAENLLILDSPDLARLYFTEWEKHRGHAEAW